MVQITEQPALTEKAVTAWMDGYARAWRERDIELVLSLFTPGVICDDNGFDPQMTGHESLKSFWTYQVRDYQRDISVALQLWGIAANQAVVNYQAAFTWLPINGRMELDGICRLTFAPQSGSEPLLCSHFKEWMHVREH